MKIQLKSDHALFQWLKDEPPLWWENLKNDPELYIDIRKKNYINVYHNGGSIMRLEGARKFNAYIHIEYIPLSREIDYCDYNLDNGNISLNAPKPIEIKNFETESLEKIKTRIRKFHPNKSEKGIQGKYVIANNFKKSGDGFFLDTEMQYGSARIDMTWVDIKTKKIAFVELKTISDDRLDINKKDENPEFVDLETVGADLLNTNKRKKPEPIDKQLKKYSKFTREHKDSILDYYDRVLCIKRDLGLLPSFVKERTLKEYKLIEKPVLLLGDCSQDWIKQNAKKLNDKLKDIAFGCLYQGTGTWNFKIPYKNARNCFSLAEA